MAKENKTVRSKYWEDRIPPQNYYYPISPYSTPPECGIDLMQLTAYAHQTGCSIAELAYEEVERFRQEEDE